MSLPTSRHAYLDCITYFDQALEDPKGIRLRQPSYDAASHLRSRMQYARKLLREDSKTFYEPGDPKHGITAYDSVVCRIRIIDQQVYLYLEQILISTDIEPLSELEEINGSDPSPRHDTGDTPIPLATSLGAGDRDGHPNRSEGGVDTAPLRSPQGIRRV